MARYRVFTFPIILFLFISCADEDKHSIQSPDNRIDLKFQMMDGIPHYSILFNGESVILPSPLGFRLKDAPSLKGDFTIVKTEKFRFDETWKPVWGQTESHRNHYNEIHITLKERTGLQREMELVFRVYDVGIGFRYILPDQPNLDKMEITSEETLFRFASDHTTWSIPDDYDSYELVFRKLNLSQLDGCNTPLTLELDNGLTMSIHEADLTDWAGMTLTPATDDSLTLKSTLVPWPDGIKVKTETPCQSPWRTIHIVDDPGKLINSGLILNLNEPCAIEDVSWIKPMKYIGIWWGMHTGMYTWHRGAKHGATTENSKRYIDFAAAHNIPAVLIEGWNYEWASWFDGDTFDFTKPYPDFNIEEVVRYGREKSVVIIGHHETGGNVPNYEAQLDDAFALYHRLGIPAVKTGYAGTIRPEGQHHHGQFMVNHYRSVVKKAAEHKITIDAHEPIKPTGISRTYPNMMTREGVRGMEYNAWSEGNTPEHTTVLPFTRMLGGPLDYTPGIFDLFFDEYKPDNRVYTTLVKQLALMVVLYSPLQMAADIPENYEGHPAFQFIEDVKVNWQETQVLHAAIGDVVSIARRAGEEWFIGSITDEEARGLALDLSFLPDGEPFVATIYSDGPDADWETNPYDYEINKYIVDNKTRLRADLAPGGGNAVAIRPATQEDVGSLPKYE